MLEKLLESCRANILNLVFVEVKILKIGKIGILREIGNAPPCEVKSFYVLRVMKDGYDRVNCLIPCLNLHHHQRPYKKILQTKKQT